MRVVHICSSIPSRGIHHYAAMLPRAMHELGVDVIVVSSPGEADPGVREQLRKRGIQVIDFPRAEKRGLKSMWESAKFLSGVFRDFRPDVVHTFGFSHAWRCWLAERVVGNLNKILIVVQLDALRNGKLEEWPARIVASQVFNRIPCMVCTLSSIESRKMQRSGLKSTKLQMVPFFIDSNELQIRMERHEDISFSFYSALIGRIGIVYLANFIPKKGHVDLLKAACLVVRCHPECIFVLAGEGPILERIRKLAFSLGISNHVLFPGRLPFQQIPTLLQRTQIGVVASHSETFGSAIIEPLLFDQPVVTTDVGFAADLAEVGGVLMVPKRNPRALAEALRRLVESPGLRQEVAKRGKAFVLENCEIHKVSQRYLEIYEACLR